MDWPLRFATSIIPVKLKTYSNRLPLADLYFESTLAPVAQIRRRYSIEKITTEIISNIIKCSLYFISRVSIDSSETAKRFRIMRVEKKMSE